MSQSFFRMGFLSFGTEFAVISSIIVEFVSTNQIGFSAFLNGLALSLMLPGSSFGVVLYLGWFLDSSWSGLILLICIHIPSLIAIYALYPYWSSLKTFHTYRRILIGLNICGVALTAVAAIEIFTFQVSSNIFRITVVAFALAIRWIYEAPHCIIVLTSVAYSVILGVVLNFLAAIQL